MPNTIAIIAHTSEEKGLSAYLVLPPSQECQLSVLLVEDFQESCTMNPYVSSRLKIKFLNNLWVILTGLFDHFNFDHNLQEYRMVYVKTTKNEYTSIYQILLKDISFIRW